MKESTVYISFSGLILWLFFMFWAQSGWYRIDCALGTPKACDLIALEYTKKERP